MSAGGLGSVLELDVAVADVLAEELELGSLPLPESQLLLELDHRAHDRLFSTFLS